MNLLQLVGFKKAQSRSEVVQHYMQKGLSDWGPDKSSAPAGWRWYPFSNKGRREFALARTRGAPQFITLDELSLLALGQLQQSLGADHATD